jgi:hypothetical protein
MLSSRTAYTLCNGNLIYRLRPPLLEPGFFLGARVDAGVVGAAENNPPAAGAGAAGAAPNSPPAAGAGAAGASL